MHLILILYSRSLITSFILLSYIQFLGMVPLALQSLLRYLQNTPFQGMRDRSKLLGMLSRDEWADLICLTYFEFFSLAKIIRLAKLIDRSVLLSIVSPMRKDLLCLSFLRFRQKSDLSSMFYRTLAFINPSFPREGIRWIPTLKELPNHRIYLESIRSGVQ
jgi:hypothetical protein